MTNHYGRNELLYDPELLQHLVDEHGNAISIKEAVDTPAFVYEIRTAVEYWFGGTNNHRCNDAIWRRCTFVDEGDWVLVGNEFRYPSQLEAS